MHFYVKIFFSKWKNKIFCLKNFGLKNIRLLPVKLQWRPKICNYFYINSERFTKCARKSPEFLWKFRGFWSNFADFGQFSPNIEISAVFGDFRSKFRGRNFLKLHLPKRWNFVQFTKFRLSWQHWLVWLFCLFSQFLRNFA